MHLISQFICVSALTLSISPLGMAQSGSDPLPGPQATSEIPSRPILMEPAIQREINLTLKQQKGLAQVQADVDSSRQQAVVGEGDEGFDFNSMMAGVEDLEKQRRAAIAKVLTPAQKTRLLQLEWQREGWMSLGRPEVASKINLSRPQIQKIQLLLTKMRQDQMQTISPISGGVPKGQQTPKTNPSNGFIDSTGGSATLLSPLDFDSDAFRAQNLKTIEAGDKIREVAGKEIDEVLTSDQKMAFQRLLGPKFDFKTLKTETAPDTGAAPPSKVRKTSPKNAVKGR